MEEKGFHTGATALGVWGGAARVLPPTAIRPPLSHTRLSLQPFTRVIFRINSGINQPTCGYLLSIMYYVLSIFLIIYKSMKHELLSFQRA